jgi:hypothetical protein
MSSGTGARDSTLIEDLDGARVQTAGARAGKGLALRQLDDGDVDPRQGQLTRQHQPGSGLSRRSPPRALSQPPTVALVDG